MSISLGTPSGFGFSGNKIPKGYNQGQIQQFTPEQGQLFQQLFSHVSPQGYLSKLAGGDQSAFEQMEAPAMRQFQQLQGQLGSRFSEFAPGAMSAGKGSGFRNVANQATSDFAQDLASRRMDLQRQALMDLMGISSTLLGQRPYEQFLTPKKKPFWQELLMGMTPGLGQGLGSSFGTRLFGIGG